MAELVQNTYANSLFEVALENSVLDTIYEEINVLKNIFFENKEYIKLFSSPVVGREEKHKLLNDTFENQLSIYTLNFLKLLVDNVRFSYILAIIDAFNQQYDEHNGILEVTATTATTLSESLQQKLVEKLNSVTQKNIRLKALVDPTILGGMKLTYNHTEIDASVKSRLEEIKQAIKQTTF